MRKFNQNNVGVGFLSFPFGALEVPETWPSVRAFTEWWFRQQCPAVFPVGVQNYRVDDATSVALFRHGQFQVELYLLDPSPIVRLHEHPGVEVITTGLPEVPESYQVSDPEKWIPLTRTLRTGEEHGLMPSMVGSSRTNGIMLAFQHWTCGVTPTTVASRWKGKTAGPLHEALIRAHNPDAFIVSGYADITRNQSKVSDL